MSPSWSCKHLIGKCWVLRWGAPLFKRFSNPIRAERAATESTSIYCVDNVEPVMRSCEDKLCKTVTVYYRVWILIGQLQSQEQTVKWRDMCLQLETLSAASICVLLTLSDRCWAHQWLTASPALSWLLVFTCLFYCHTQHIQFVFKATQLSLLCELKDFVKYSQCSQIPIACLTMLWLFYHVFEGGCGKGGSLAVRFLGQYSEPLVNGKTIVL